MTVRLEVDGAPLRELIKQIVERGQAKFDEELRRKAREVLRDCVSVRVQHLARSAKVTEDQALRVAEQMVGGPAAFLVPRAGLVEPQ